MGLKTALGRLNQVKHFNEDSTILIKHCFPKSSKLTLRGVGVILILGIDCWVKIVGFRKKRCYIKLVGLKTVYTFVLVLKRLMEWGNDMRRVREKEGLGKFVSEKGARSV